MLGNGDGSFSVRSGVGTGLFGGPIALGNFTGAGKVDLGVKVLDNILAAVFPRNGDGTFGAPIEPATGGSSDRLVAADFDGDGKLDVACVDYNGSNSVLVAYGMGNGRFTPAPGAPVGGLPTALAVGDFNGDGRPDLAVVDNSTADVSVLLGTGRR